MQLEIIATGDAVTTDLVEECGDLAVPGDAGVGLEVEPGRQHEGALGGPRVRQHHLGSVGDAVADHDQVDVERPRGVGLDVVATLTAHDVPEPSGGYRIAVGPAADPVTVARLTNDLTVAEASAVLLPFLLDPDTDMVAGRFVFSDQGVLRFARKDTTMQETA